METKVVNMNDITAFGGLTSGIYIGRKRGYLYHYGNPFIIGVDGTRSEVIKKFRNWLAGVAYTHIEPERRKWILENICLGLLDEEILICHCKPKTCHGDIYVDLVKEKNEKMRAGASSE